MSDEDIKLALSVIDKVLAKLGYLVPCVGVKGGEFHADLVCGKRDIVVARGRGKTLAAALGAAIEERRAQLERPADAVAPSDDAEYRVVRTWPSSKGDGKVYELREGRDGQVYCTCPAWRFSKERPRTCKHLAAWADAIAVRGKAILGGG